MRDVRCAQGHYECNVLVEREGAPTGCPECGLPRTTFYATREQQGEEARLRTQDPNAFLTIRVADKVFHDRASFDAHVADFARRNGVSPSDVNVESAGSARQKRARSDELRHEAHDMRRKSGFDETSTRQYQAEQRERPTPRRVP